jgi:signal transduction histidine kinase
MFWQEFFSTNRIIILSIYGQVFFVLGLAIFLQSRRHSRLKLARDLRWLALFGLLHGLHEWGLVFIPIQAEYAPGAVITLLQVGQVLLLAASFACLLLFGVVLLDAEERRYRWFVIVLVGGWILAAAISYVVAPELDRWVSLSTIWARYLLGLPGAALAAGGLYRQSQSMAVTMRGQKFSPMLRRAGHALVVYAILAGLVAPQASFFPANILNQQMLESWSGIPVEFLRSLAGFFLTVSIIRALELFEVEVDRLIETMEVEAIQSAERDRIGQEIHDGAMQGIYSVSLILNSMTKHVDSAPAMQRLAQAQLVLERVILDLRHYMTSLRIHPPQKPLTVELANLVVDPRFSSLVDINLEIQSCPKLDEEQTGHLLGLIQEGLSNIVRHAAASQATIGIRCEGERFIVKIQDNGHGFDMSNSRKGYGLKTMRNHAQMLGAAMTIDSIQGKGTIITVAGTDTAGTDTAGTNMQRMDNALV